MDHYAIDRVRAEEMDSLFALVRLGSGDITLDQWRAMAGRMADLPPDKGGALAARDGMGRARGLLVFSITPAHMSGPVLQIERLTAFDLTSPADVGAALIRAAMDVAVATRCGGFSVIESLPDAHSAVSRTLNSDASIMHRIV